MRLTHEILTHLSRDEDQLQSHFKRAQTVSRVTIDTYEEHAGSAFKVLDTQSKVLTIGDVTSPAKGLYMEVDADCDVFLNGSLDPVQLRKAPAPPTASPVPAAPFAKLFLEGNITSIQVTASQSKDVSGTYIVWGDVTP